MRKKPIYPPGWKAFSLHIRTVRADNQCECTGECGLHSTHPGPRRCTERNGTPARWANGLICLTTAHLCDCDPPCIEESHVKAMCNRCHLRLDIPLHMKHAAESRRLQKEREGQMPLLSE